MTTGVLSSQQLFYHLTEVVVGRAVTDHMSPIELASGEAGEAARSGRSPKTPMAVFSASINDPRVNSISCLRTSVRLRDSADALVERYAVVVAGKLPSLYAPDCSEVPPCPYSPASSRLSPS